jgi:hypothetical protein
VPPASEASRPATLRERANQFQSLIDEKLWAQWPSGALVNLQYADATMGQVTGYNDPEDAAIWTGVYTAAQAFRYASVNDPEEKKKALATVREAVLALDTLARVPGYPGGLARVASKNQQVLAQSGCQTSNPPSCYETNGVYWVGNTSRDQYTGWFFGMATAWRLVEDREIRRMIADDVRTMITAIHNWNYVLQGPNGQVSSGTAGQVHHQMRISWHLIAATILNEPLYWEWYKEQTQFLDLAEADLEDAADGTNLYYDYYSYNLGFLNGFNMVILETDPRLRAFYLEMLENELYRYVQNTDNAFFDYMTMAARGQTSPETLTQDRNALAVFPGPPSIWSCVQPPWRPLDRASVHLYWVNKLLYAKKVEAYPQSATPYRLDERCRVNFLWQQSPYKESCCCTCPSSTPSCPTSTYSSQYCSETPSPQPYTVYPGADYLVAYWMGRYYGFLTENE